jgi:hypothetical protein
MHRPSTKNMICSTTTLQSEAAWSAVCGKQQVARQIFPTGLG